MPSAQQLARQARRLDRRGARVRAVLDAMSAGAVLHLEFCHGAPRLWLSTAVDTPVPPGVAAHVVNHERVVAVGRALFENLTPAQAYRYIGRK